MCVIEAGGDASQISQGDLRVERRLRHLSGQAAAGNELHDHIRSSVEFAEVVDVDDVGVAHLGDRLRLVAEAGHCVGPDGYPLEDLDGASSFELGVVGLVDETHRALADELLDFIGAELGPWLDRHGPLIMRWASGGLSRRMTRCGHDKENEISASSGRTDAPRHRRWCRLQRGAPCFQPPWPPLLTATKPARMERAISWGVTRAPRSRPTGLWIRAITSGGAPLARSASR